MENLETKILTFQKEEFYGICRILTAINDSFIIGYNKDIGSHILTITCYSTQYDDLLKFINDFKDNNLFD